MPVTTPMTRGEDYDDTIRQRSGWLIPVGVFAVTAVLSAVVLLYYLAPTPQSFIEEHPAPTSQTDPVNFSVNGVALSIPANYVLYKSARQGGRRGDIALFAALPDLHGYNDWESQTFAGDTPDSPVVYMLIRGEFVNLSESERLRRIYLSLVSNPAGKPGPFGLVKYTFRDDSGYREEDLFVGPTPSGPAVMRCDRFSAQNTSPSCLRDMLVTRGVALSYRFKRAHLDEWTAIASGVTQLFRSFRVHQS